MIFSKWFPRLPRNSKKSWADRIPSHERSFSGTGSLWRARLRVSLSLLLSSTLAGMFAFFATFVVFPGELAAQAPDQVRRVVAKVNSLGSFKARVSLGGVSGNLSYQRGRFHLALSDGRVIASNGKTMVVYNPATRVAGKQPVSGSGGGLGWILGEGYEWRVRGSEAFGAAVSGGANYEQVRIGWDDEYMLRKLAVKKSAESEWYTITVSNVRQVSGFSASLFSYSPPAGSRTVENPLDQSR